MKLLFFRKNKPETNVHWTKRPENRAKVMEVSRAMKAGRDRKRELAHQ